MTTSPGPRPETAGREPDNLEPALGGLRVIELAAGVSGPYCGKMLADYGADVIKVELPEGDPSREVGPFPEGEHDAGALFLWLNANKRGITLDWRKRSGRRVLRDLLRWADVLVESGPPATLSRLRLDPTSLAQLNPRLVVTEVTPFGRTGPWRDRPATDLTISALGGFSNINGAAGQEPLKEPGPQTDVLAGAFAYVGILCALADREVTGLGQAVDVSALEAVAGVLTPRITQYSYQGVNHPRRQPGTETLFPCQDGYISVPPVTPKAFQSMFEILGLDKAGLEPTPPEAARRFNLETVRPTVEATTARYPKAELFHKLASGRVNAGMVMSFPDLRSDPHLQARGFFTSVADPRVGELTYLGPPFRLEACNWRIRRPAPRLGEHNDEILGSLLDYTPQRRAALRQAGVTSRERSNR